MSRTPKHSCTQCGLCCRKHVLDVVRRSDVLRWRREGRRDILKHVQLSKNGKYPTQQTWKGMGYATLGRCPFLRHRGKKYWCGIHRTKPYDCRIYPNGRPGCARDKWVS